MIKDNKEIIIDEINLKKCKYFKGVGCINSSFKFWGCSKLGGMCSEHPNCYFKQLKCKEQLINKIKKYCEKISNDERAMCGEHLACDDILHIIKKTKEGE